MATTKHILSRVQRQRAEALRRAREVLASGGLMSQGAVDALDVIRVADYILSGVEYLDRPPAPQPDYTEQNRKAIEEEVVQGKAWIKRSDYGPWERLGGITDTGFTLAGDPIGHMDYAAPPAEPPYTFSPKLDGALNKLFEEPPLPDGRLHPSVRDLLDGRVPPSWGEGDDGMPGRSAG